MEGTSNETSKIRPLADRVVVKPFHQEEVTRGGIVIPDTVKEKPQEGAVVAVGSGQRNEKGERVLCRAVSSNRTRRSRFCSPANRHGPDS